MKKRYRVLRVAIVLIKIFAVLECILLLARWSFLLVVVEGFFTALGVHLDTTVLQAITDIVQDILVIIVGIFLWARADYIQAHIDTEENTRATALLLWRLVKYQIPPEDAEYMRSLHGVWDEAPAAHTPDDHWKRTPVSPPNAVSPTDVIEKRQDYLRPKDQGGKPEPNYRAFRRPKDHGDPPSW